MPAIAAWRRAVAVPSLLLVTALSGTMLSAVSAEAAPQPSRSVEVKQQAPAAKQHLSKRERKLRKIKKGLRVALRQKGDPYVYGAEGPNAFDCSGLLMYSFGKAGLRLPRTSSDQARFARRIPKHNLKRGDLMFFHSGGSVYHAAIFLDRVHGKPLLLHAPHTGSHVKRDVVWTNSWYAETLRPRRH